MTHRWKVWVFSTMVRRIVKENKHKNRRCQSAAEMWRNWQTSSSFEPIFWYFLVWQLDKIIPPRVPRVIFFYISLNIIEYLFIPGDSKIISNTLIDWLTRPYSIFFAISYELEIQFAHHWEAFFNFKPQHLFKLWNVLTITPVCWNLNFFFFF